MKKKLEQIQEVKLITAAKAIRAAWIDEQMDAEARGDTARAATAAALVTECNRKIAALRQARGGALQRFAAHITAMIH